MQINNNKVCDPVEHGFKKYTLRSRRSRLSLNPDYVQSSLVPNSWANLMSVNKYLVPDRVFGQSLRVLFQVSETSQWL